MWKPYSGCNNLLNRPMVRESLKIGRPVHSVSKPKKMPSKRKSAIKSRLQSKVVAAVEEAPPKPPVWELYPDLWQPVDAKACSCGIELYIKLMMLDPSSWIHFDEDGCLCIEKGCFESLQSMWAAPAASSSEKVQAQFLAAMQDSTGSAGWVPFLSFSGVAVRRRAGYMFLCIQGRISASAIVDGKLKNAVMQATIALANREQHNAQQSL